MPPRSVVEDLRPAIRRFKAGHWLALATTLLIVLGAAAKATGAPFWLTGTIWAAMAACAVVSAAWMVPTCVRFKRLAKRNDRSR